MYRFLVDEDSPKGIARLLVENGFDAIHVVDAGLAGTKDKNLAAWAKEQNRIIITRDLEFGNLLLYPLGAMPGIILIRVPDKYTAQAITALFAMCLEFLEEGKRFRNGSLVILEPDKVRIRSLEY